MQRQSIEFMGRRLDILLHPDPDHLATVIKANRTFYELDVLMKCREIYLPGTTIIDVGANIGNHTLFFAGVMGASVHAFEPHGPSFDLLQLAVAINRLQSNVQLCPAAIGAQDGFAIMTDGPTTNRGMTACIAGDGEIPMVRLDSIAFGQPVGLIKIDVEGSEVAVLQGAIRLLQTWRPDLMIEAAAPAAFASVARFLLDLGYLPRGRFAATPTYLFAAADQTARLRAVLGSPGSD
jgi:FkbM family methyltransferase